MSTGVQIQSAKYGVGTKTVDVKSTVTGLLADGKLNIVVTPATLNVNDPAPGQVKTLTVTYTINGGSSNIVSAVDNEAIQIDAPPARTASGLQIKKAEYGYDGNYQDVTSAVRTYLNNGTIDVKVNPGNMGIPDPNPQKAKFLKVQVTINGEPSNYTIPDGQKFRLSAPAVQATTDHTPAADFLGLIWSILYDILLACWFFFLFSITIESYHYGSTLFTGGGFVMGFLAFITSGVFPILILPFWIFGWCLIFGGKTT
jgi:hypothetical protein